MTAHVGDDVRAADHATGVDEERVSPRERCVLVVGGTDDVVCGADGAVDIAEQLVAEALLLGEGEVLGGRVERRAEDQAVGGGELLGAVTQRLTFDRSTRRRGLGVPPQQHPTTAQLVEADLLVVLIREAEARSGRTDCEEHRARLGAS